MVELVQHGSGRGISLDQGEEIFPLRQIQVRRVELEERLALVDEFAGGVHVERLDPARNAGRHFGDGRLVEFNLADRADGAMTGPCVTGAVRTPMFCIVTGSIVMAVLSSSPS